MKIISAILSLLQVLSVVFGITPVDYNVNYGGDTYVAPVINEEMVIIEDGSTDFVIVYADDADECINTAVSELQLYLEKISGVKIDAVKESEFSGGKAILIGETQLENSVTEINRDDIFADGFILYSDGNYLIITGAQSRGTLYGVYTLLEEYFGVRWFTPELEIIPGNDRVVIDAAINRKVEPSFEVRRNSTTGSSNEYRAKMKVNVSFHYEAEEYGGAINYVLWDSTMEKLVPDTLFREHPEYFMLDENGVRSTDKVCMSNPGSLAVAIESARKAILACDRNATYIHIGQKDNDRYCHCENCTELYEKYGSISAPTLLFTNAFADALDDEFPYMNFTFYAYLETRYAPTTDDIHCNDNVAPVICALSDVCECHPIDECGATDGDESFMNLFGEKEATIAQAHIDWTKYADKTYIYDYTINFLYSAQFHSNFGTMQDTMKYMHDIGITGYMYNCGDGHSAAFNELRNYLLCKLQWDVDADVEYHMMDFIKAYYGEAAAPYIRKILDIQTACTSATAHSFNSAWYYQTGYYPVSAINELNTLWNAALNADVTPEQMFNIETASLSWRFFKANQMLCEYSFLNPLRMYENEKLYDDLKSHGLDRVSCYWIIPEKENVNFILRPYNWNNS